MKAQLMGRGSDEGSCCFIRSPGMNLNWPLRNGLDDLG